MARHKEENSNVEAIKRIAILRYGSFNKYSEALDKSASNHIRDLRRWFKTMDHVLEPLGYEVTIKKTKDEKKG